MLSGKSFLVSFRDGGFTENSQKLHKVPQIFSHPTEPKKAKINALFPAHISN